MFQNIAYIQHTFYNFTCHISITPLCNVRFKNISFKCILLKQGAFKIRIYKLHM